MSTSTSVWLAIDALEKRVGEVERRNAKEMVGPIWQEGGIAGDFVAYSPEVIARWRRIEAEHAECKTRLDKAFDSNLMHESIVIRENEELKAKLARAGRIEAAAVDLITTAERYDWVQLGGRVIKALRKAIGSRGEGE